MGLEVQIESLGLEDAPSGALVQACRRGPSRTGNTITRRVYQRMHGRPRGPQLQTKRSESLGLEDELSGARKVVQQTHWWCCRMMKTFRTRDRWMVAGSNPG